jgi:Cu/Ag efflux protein CusF
MSDIKNESIDHLADTYASTESDAKAYQKAQAATIVSQTKEINVLRKQKEQLEKEFEKLTMEHVQLKALNPAGTAQFEVSDEETIAIVQLAILKNLAMQRELTLEETKKCEIFTKLLVVIRGKVETKDEPASLSGLDAAELTKLMKEMF